MASITRVIKKIPKKDIKSKVNQNIGSGGGQLIVSLTSYPPRIPTLHYTLHSLLMQTFKPNKVILWLSTLEFPNKEQDLQQSVLSFVPYGLEIAWCEDNIKSYKKLIPTLKAYPDAVIVTADDDVIYPQDWLEKLCRAYIQNPKFIHCHRAHKISFDASGALLPYAQWQSAISHQETSPSFLNFFTGVGGVLYPPRCFHTDVLDEYKFLKFLSHQDDIWFWAMVVLNSVKINVVEGNYTDNDLLTYVDIGKTGALWLTNLRGENDKALQNIFTLYPELKEKIKFDSSEYWENRYKSYNGFLNPNDFAGGGYRCFWCR